MDEAQRKDKRHSSKNAQKIEARKIGVIDFETDPFLYGRIPKPFAGGFYDGEKFTCTWGPNCADELVRLLDTIKIPMLIYAHNGGKFDFHFLLKYLGSKVKIIGNRLVSCTIGIHELRDSYAAIPIKLSDYEKTTIDYEKFEVECRDAHKTEIIDYLKDDCIFLHTLITGFVKRFGPQLTIGGVAIKEMMARHPFERQRENHDKKFRQFYFGGRVQCFKYGVFNEPVKIYDVNSMYSGAMKNAIHPCGARYLSVRGAVMDKRGRISGIADAPFYFAKVMATVSNGGLPQRTKYGLDFHCKGGEFWSTSHELKLLCELGMIKVHKVLEAHAPFETISFGEFVDQFSNEKINAKERGDKAAAIFAKYILNSPYGKTAQNPENYQDYLLMHGDVPPLILDGKGNPLPDSEQYRLGADMEDFQIWGKPVVRHSYYDVAIGASITSAARAVLLQGLISAKNPMYCDTDSIICTGPGTLDIHPTRLGAWKLEGEGDKIALAGKKLYSVFQDDTIFNCFHEIKSASKGAILNGAEIERIANGEKIRWRNQAPTFSLINPPSFIDREIQSVFT